MRLRSGWSYGSPPGLATIAIAFILYKTGAKKMRATELAPHRTEETIGRMPKAAAGNL
jgi:hypothetical protein